MAYIVEISNPFEPFKDTRCSEVAEGITIRAWLEQRFPGFTAFQRPTLITCNGHPVMQADWSTRKLERKDVVNIIALPGDPVTILYVLYAVLVVATVVIAVNARQNLPTPGQTPEADPVYTLKGQRNQIRLGEPIEVPYGRTRMWPSYAAMPYNKYANNQQWLYQLFCLGQGRFTIEDLFIEDTPVSEFQDVEVEICPPGTPVTLFPDNVITSVEVGNIELFGPNEPEGSGEYIVDSEGDAELGIPETGHYAYSNAGPFIANPTQTETNLIEIDVSFPRGLFVQNNEGDVGEKNVTALFEARKIDDAGAPLGDWFTISSFSKTLATITPQRFTIECVVPLGRYQVRGARTSNKDTSSRAGNTLHWESLRAFLPSVSDYGDVTMMAVKARASNNLNDNAASRFNCFAVRWLPSWNVALQEWNEAAPTRSLVWAFCDIFRATYGGRLADAFLDLDALAALNSTFTEREEFFDWIFDQRLTVWDAARLAAIIGRAVPMLNGSRVTMIRDEPKTLATAIFNQENIVKGSFKHEIKLHAVDAYDGLEVEYIDPDTWKSETVTCLLPLSGGGFEAGDNLEKVKLNGVTSRTHAYRWGMWKRAVARYRREQATFRTGLEGHIPSYGDPIGVAHDVPRWGSGGFVVAINEAGTGLTLSEPVTFDGTCKIMLRKKTGQSTGALAVSAGADAFHVTLAAPIDDADFAFDPKKEPPLFMFGKSALFDKFCIVTNLMPADNDEVEVVATPYRSEPHSFDEYVAPPKGETEGGLPTRPALPSVTGLTVVRSPEMANQVIAQWVPTSGAKYYIIQLSYDGSAWETLSDFVEGTNFRFSVLPRYIYVRVSAVVTGAGPWAYWTGDAPVEKTNVIIDNDATPNGVTGVSITAGFGLLWLNWTNSTNSRLKMTHVYASTTETQPPAPQFSITTPQAFLAHSGLADNEEWNYWFVEESVGGKFSAVVGPFTGTTVNGITLDHLIPGGLQPVEIVSVLPSTGNYQGRVVFLTADDNVGGSWAKDKLYRWAGLGTPAAPVTGKASWTAAVPTVDLTGQIISGQIADNAILTAKLADNAITQAKLQDAIVSTAKLVDAAITEVKIATGAVITSKIADNAISQTKLQTAIIDNTRLVDGAVDAVKLASGAVTSAKIAADAVTSAAVAAGAITTTKIADDAISTPKLAAGSITAAKIGAGEITAGKIAAGAVTAGTIAADAVTATTIAAGAITTAKIAAGAITATELAAGSVTAAKIGAGEITAAKLAAGSVEADKIAANAITAAKIGAGEVVAGKIAAGAISTTELAAGAVTAAKIGAGEVVADKIFAGAITSDKIAANAVTAAKLAAGAVEADKIAANAITSDKIDANAITAGKIQAGAITATAVGTNQIIAYTANIADGVITKAKIASLEAAKIEAGTLNAMTLTAGKIATDYQVFNTGAPSSYFPVLAYQNAQEPSTPQTGFSGTPTDFWMITYWGWATGTGFVQDRFGKSSMNFLCLENGGCTPTVSGWVDLEIICRVNGGTPFQVNPYAVRAISGNGSLNINGAVQLTGLTSTDTVEFGLRIKADNGSDQWNVGNLTVLALNL